MPEKTSRSFHVACFEEIRDGQIADVYFLRTRQILERKKIHKRVLAEFTVKYLPHPYKWAIFAGLEEALSLLEGLPVTVWAVPEGTLFRRNDPLLYIEGDYLDFGVYETALLGFFCQASGIATKAARDRIAAGDRILLSFGARRMHPAIAPMIERNAYIGGCDGVAVVKSAELLGIPPSGTIPHALILIIGDTVEAVRAFDEVIAPEVKRIALIDTFHDEKFEAIRVAEAMGEKLFGIRLDTPGSRRGNFAEILREVRWELNLRGYEKVKIFLSGGLDENSIRELRPLADGFGVGTSLSNARVLDFAMDIVEIEGEPVAKRGKASGRKDLFRCDRCLQSVVLPHGQQPLDPCECGGKWQPMLEKVLENGKLVQAAAAPQDIRNRVLEQLKRLQAADPEPLSPPS
jgi:nicotinate phosphoribosyltransferase